MKFYTVNVKKPLTLIFDDETFARVTKKNWVAATAAVNTCQTKWETNEIWIILCFLKSCHRNKKSSCACDFYWNQQKRTDTHAHTHAHTRTYTLSTVKQSILEMFLHLYVNLNSNKNGESCHSKPNSKVMQRIGNFNGTWNMVIKSFHFSFLPFFPLLPSFALLPPTIKLKAQFHEAKRFRGKKMQKTVQTAKKAKWKSFAKHLYRINVWMFIYRNAKEASRCL